MATGEIASRAPTLGEIRKGSFTSRGWTEVGQLEQRGNKPHEVQRRMTIRANSFPLRVQTLRAQELGTVREKSRIPEQSTEDAEGEGTPTTGGIGGPDGTTSEVSTFDKLFPPQVKVHAAPDETGMYPNGYRFPPKPTWQQSIAIGLKAFGSFTLTPFGFLVTIYCLNIIAWGAMIFFLLLNAAPAMCNPSCDASDSARQRWMEIDTQVLTALFCVTAFGLIPWRFRDFYYLMKWRALNCNNSLRRLAGVHRAWYRLPGSDSLPDYIGPPPVYSAKNPRPRDAIFSTYSEEQFQALTAHPAVPLPLTSMPNAPLTGIRASPTTPWYLDLLIWMYVLNTLFQAALCGLVWGVSKNKRSTAGVAVMITLGCVSGLVAGLVTFVQGRRVKNIEGIPVPEDPDSERLKTAGTGDAISDSGSAQEKGLITKLVRRDSHWYRRH